MELIARLVVAVVMILSSALAPRSQVQPDVTLVKRGVSFETMLGNGFRANSPVPSMTETQAVPAAGAPKPATAISPKRVAPRRVAEAPHKTMARKPVPKPVIVLGRSVSGQATYYCCTIHHGPGEYVGAAGPRLRAALGIHWRGRTVVVSYAGRSIRVRLVDWCGCPYGRVIDLHPGPFSALRRLSFGVAPVKVSW